MNKLHKFLATKHGELISGLLCGIAYFIVVLDFIMANTHTGGQLLAMFLAPAVICGVALMFIKLIRGWLQNEQYKNINSFIVLNLVIFVISIFFIIDFCINH